MVVPPPTPAATLQAERDPDGVGVRVDAPLEVSWRLTDEHVWLVALHTVDAAGTGVLHVDGATGEVAVHGEAQRIALDAGTFTDTFGPYEARIYAAPRP